MSLTLCRAKSECYMTSSRKSHTETLEWLWTVPTISRISLGKRILLRRSTIRRRVYAIEINVHVIDPPLLVPEGLVVFILNADLSVRSILLLGLPSDWIAERVSSPFLRNGYIRGVFPSTYWSVVVESIWGIRSADIGSLRWRRNRTHP